MSQNDFNIANQGFPSFRSDLNSALQALASTSSGATAPATPYANQLWYDTANDLLKIRNEANSAWVNLFGVSTDGFVIEDKIVHAGDTDTAIRFPAADTVTVETNGAERMRITSTGNVGIGTGSPDASLDIERLNDTENTNVPTLRFTDSDTSQNAGQKAGQIEFATNDTAPGPIGVYGFINAQAEGTSGLGALIFGTGQSGSATERMRITSAGRVGIGTTSPSSALDVNGTIRSNSWAGTVSSTGYGAIIERGSNANGDFVKYADGTMICTNTGFVVNFTSVNLLSSIWTYPVAFIANPIITHTLNEDSSAGNFSISQDIFPQVGTTTTTSSSIRVRGQSTGWTSGATCGAYLSAIGRWF